MHNLTDLYSALSPPEDLSSGATRYSTAQVPGLKGYRIGKDVQSTPAILISASANSQLASPPIVLENLTVEHDLVCSIYELGEVKREGCFTIIHCTSPDRVLHAHFLQLAANLIRSLGQSPSRSVISEVINSLVELFQALGAPPLKTTQGIWAELFLISKASDPVCLGRSWHATPKEIFDFSDGNQRIEVKSTTGRIRQHHFSLAQVRPSAGIKTLIASLLVERSEVGISVKDLVGLIKHDVMGDAALCFHIDRVVSLTLGNTWRHAAEDRFDSKVANGSLAFFWAEDVPAVSEVMPGSVSDVRFRSDLSGVDTVPLISLATAQGLFRAVAPR